jgi:hypothetical protein
MRSGRPFMMKIGQVMRCATPTSDSVAASILRGAIAAPSMHALLLRPNRRLRPLSGCRSFNALQIGVDGR